MSRRRLAPWIFTVLALALIVVLSLVAFGTGGDAEVSGLTPRALPVTTIEASAITSLHTLREYTGKVVARRESELGFERAGKVVAVLVDQGQLVEAGEELARLDTRHLLTEQRRLEARLREASAQLEELVAGPRKEQIAAAEAEVRNLSAQKQLQELNLTRRASLLTSNAISREDYDNVRFGLDATSARLDAAQHLLEELRAGTRPEQIAAAEAVVEQLEATLADIAHDLEDCVLKAPFSGMVADRFVDEGQVITSQTIVTRIVEDAAPEAWVGLPPDAARQICTGQQVTLRVGKRELDGVVTAVLPELDLATRTRRVVARLGKDATVLPGQLVRLEVSEEITTAGFRLPSSALASASRGLWCCYAVVPDQNGSHRVQRRDVEVLYTSGEQVVVRGTIQDGDTIIAGGTHRVAQGQLVHVVPAPEEQTFAEDQSKDGAGRRVITAASSNSSKKI